MYKGTLRPNELRKNIMAVTARPEIRGFFDEPTNTVSYLVWDPASKEGAVIDPVLNFDHRSGDATVESADALIEIEHRVDDRTFFGRGIPNEIAHRVGGLVKKTANLRPGGHCHDVFPQLVRSQGPLIHLIFYI